MAATTARRRAALGKHDAQTERHHDQKNQTLHKCFRCFAQPESHGSSGLRLVSPAAAGAPGIDLAEARSRELTFRLRVDRRLDHARRARPEVVNPAVLRRHGGDEWRPVMAPVAVCRAHRISFPTARSTTVSIACSSDNTANTWLPWRTLSARMPVPWQGLQAFPPRRLDPTTTSNFLP